MAHGPFRFKDNIVEVMLDKTSLREVQRWYEWVCGVELEREAEGPSATIARSRYFFCQGQGYRTYPMNCAKINGFDMQKRRSHKGEGCALFEGPFFVAPPPPPIGGGLGPFFRTGVWAPVVEV